MLFYSETVQTIRSITIIQCSISNYRVQNSCECVGDGKGAISHTTWNRKQETLRRIKREAPSRQNDGLSGTFVGQLCFFSRKISRIFDSGETLYHIREISFNANYQTVQSAAI